jgi:hypothetical protein
VFDTVADQLGVGKKTTFRKKEFINACRDDRVCTHAGYRK